MIPLLLLAGTALLLGKYAHDVLRAHDLGTMSAEWLVEYRRQAQTIS
jgi:hypothetical protein